MSVRATPHRARSHPPPERVLAELEQRGSRTAVLAGGAQIYRAFLAAGLVDELWLTIEPLAFGAGITLFGDDPLDLRLALLECRQLNADSVHLRYRILRSGPLRAPRDSFPAPPRWAAPSAYADWR